MAITRNLKPLGVTGIETRDELIKRFFHWTSWYEANLALFEQEAIREKEETARWKERQEAKLQEIQLQCADGGFHCNCHKLLTTVRKLHEALMKAESRLARVSEVMSERYYDEY